MINILEYPSLHDRRHRRHDVRKQLQPSIYSIKSLPTPYNVSYQRSFLTLHATFADLNRPSFFSAGNRIWYQLPKGLLLPSPWTLSSLVCCPTFMAPLFLSTFDHKSQRPVQFNMCVDAPMRALHFKGKRRGELFGKLRYWKNPALRGFERLQVTGRWPSIIKLTNPAKDPASHYWWNFLPLKS